MFSVLKIDAAMNTIQEQTKTNAREQRELDAALTKLVKKEERVDELSNVNRLLLYSTLMQYAVSTFLPQEPFQEP